MKLNQWTLGLAAVGVVTLASAVQADEAKNQVLTAVSSTTLSGYVSTSARWDLGTGAAANNFAYGGGKSDGFNLDVVDLTVSKNVSEGDWGAGYKAELWLGWDAAGLGTFWNELPIAIKQAYVALRAPIGNGLNLKLGVFDTIIGYESSNATDNPNYTRSWAYTIEPTQHTGLVADYRFCDAASASFGVVNTTDPLINGRMASSSQKSYIGAVTLTAPDSFGFLKGATATAGVVDGRANQAAGPNTQNIYVGATLPSGLDGLTLGAAYDVKHQDVPGTTAYDATSISGYISYKASDKLKVNARIEYFDPNQTSGINLGAAKTGAFNAGTEVLTSTVTLDYALWENVISRGEYRWDHDTSGSYSFGGAGHPRDNAHLLALNLIYKF